MRARTPTSRPGFTLIELIASMGVVSLVFGAIGALMVLGIRAVPTEGSASSDAAALIDAIDRIEADFASATEITLAAADRVTFTIRDRDTDGNDEKIEIRWASANSPITRAINDGTAVPITPDINSAGLSYLKNDEGLVTAIHFDLRLSSLGILRESVVIDGGVTAP